MLTDNLLGLSFGVIIAIILIGLLALIFVIYTLIHQYNKKKFGWFWATLLLTLLSGLGLLTAIIYWIYYSIKR